MSWEAATILKQQVPLQRYLESQHWKPVRRMAGGRLLGLCPLHHDRKPSFLVDPAKNLFYCYGCSRGGDVIRFVELYNGVRFSQAMALLRASFACGALLKEVTNFYRIQLHRPPEAVSYLQQRGIYEPQVIDELEIGLRSRGLPSPLAHDSGLFPERTAASWPGQRDWPRHIQPSYCLSPRNERIWPKHRKRRSAPLSAKLQGRSLSLASG